MKYNKQLAKDYEHALVNMCMAYATYDTYGALCAMHDLMKCARQRTAEGYSIRETYKKTMPHLMTGADTLCNTSTLPELNTFGGVIDHVFPSTVDSDQSAIMYFTLFFSMVRYILVTDDYPDEYFGMLNACEERGEDGLVNMLPIVYDPETGDK